MISLVTVNSQYQTLILLINLEANIYIPDYIVRQILSFQAGLHVRECVVILFHVLGAISLVDVVRYSHCNIAKE